MTTTIYIGDCRAAMRRLAAGSVHCVVTSPPYYNLRKAAPLLARVNLVTVKE